MLLFKWTVVWVFVAVVVLCVCVCVCECVCVQMAVSLPQATQVISGFLL